jgi:hypothetical protein
MDENLTPTPASQWKGNNVEGSDLLLPSGNVARVRQVSPQTFLTGGILPDPLSAIISETVRSKKGLPPEKIKEMQEDPEILSSSLELFDRVLAYVMVMPVVLMPPTCTECKEYYNVDDRHSNVNNPEYHSYTEGQRRTDVLYADAVDMADKVFIFKHVMTGVRDLENFRSELPASLGGLLDEQDVQHETQPVA